MTLVLRDRTLVHLRRSVDAGNGKRCEQETGQQRKGQ
jgi:hypothetical protein